MKEPRSYCSLLGLATGLFLAETGSAEGTTGKVPNEKEYQVVVKLIADHLQPPSSIIVARCCFGQHLQKVGESCKIYVAELQSLAQNSKFENQLNERLRDQVMVSSDDEETCHLCKQVGKYNGAMEDKVMCVNANPSRDRDEDDADALVWIWPFIVMENPSRSLNRLIIQIHHTTPAGNGETHRVRFVHVAFNEIGEQLAAADHRGNIFIIDLNSNKLTRFRVLCLTVQSALVSFLRTCTGRSNHPPYCLDRPTVHSNFVGTPFTVPTSHRDSRCQDYFLPPTATPVLPGLPPYTPRLSPSAGPRHRQFHEMVYTRRSGKAHQSKTLKSTSSILAPSKSWNLYCYRLFPTQERIATSRDG
uniref:Uncharacterized protein n=1 Tax=Timema poppense TaxID=170557 RepID=A0A7R9CNY2_TIMPO|nr:unnamed protein product [Timema poppensis]